MNKFFLFFLGVWCLSACAYRKSLPEGYAPRFSSYVGYKEEVLTLAFGRPERVYYDDYGRRYLVYDTFSMSRDSTQYNPYRCNTMFLTQSGFIKASYFNEDKCIRER